MGNIDKTCNLWARTITTGGDEYASKRYSNCNVYFQGKTIYSYGSHFPMAYILAPDVVWFNGDRFSVSTGRHQAELRSAIRQHAPDATVVIVPRTALGGANVDYKTIVPVDVHGERWEYTEQTSIEAPADMVADVPGGASYASNYVYDYPDAVGHVTRDGSVQTVRLFDGLYHWHTARHWLGDAVFTAIRDRWFDGTVGERVPFLSSFDRQERRPLYFLSQLPHAVDTVDAAIESLTPDSVKTARDMGRAAVRQGDMFAIPMNVTTRQLRAMGADIKKRHVTVEPMQRALEGMAVRTALEWIAEGMPARPVWDYGTGAWDDYAACRAASDAWQDKLCQRYSALFPTLPDVRPYNLDSALGYEPRARWDYVRTVDATALYGTAHTATEVATLPDGRQFARGVLYHDPAVIGQRRDADHARRPLGKQWHLMARNTVPVSGTGQGRRLEAGRSLTAA